MSLKTRLRFAVSVLMAAVVIALSLLNVHSFLSNDFKRTAEIASSLAGQIQTATRERLERMPTTSTAPEEIKRLWKETVVTDPIFTAMLRRALDNWHLMTEVYMTDGDGKVLASTAAPKVGSQASNEHDIAAWEHRSAFDIARQVFVSQEDAESREPLAIQGESKPFLTTHVVVSVAMLRDEMKRPLRALGTVFAISLIVSLILAVLLPNLVVDPLERLSRQLDLMATGKFAVAPKGQRHEAKEFEAVYSKLDLLGQQFLGARENVDDMRSNVEHLLDKMEQAVMLADPAGRLMMAGTNAGRLLGLGAESVNGRLLADLVTPRSELAAVIDEAIKGQQPIRERIVKMLTGEVERTLSVSCEPLPRGADGRAVGTLITMRDAETRGKIEEELGLAARLAALGRLTRGVAHEIKNPLNAITLHLEVLRSRLEEPAPEVDVIIREISRLDRVVKTFLDFNRPVEPRMRQVDLTEMADDVAQLVGPQAKGRKIEIVLGDGTPAMILGDRDLLKQAVLNVVMNAMDAMPEGGRISIATRRNSGRCELAVTDTGPGIPAEVQDRIFSLYFTTKKQGSGIGLAIAYRFVQLHDGKLEFSSETGKGTHFLFSFPEAVSAPRGPQLAISRTQGA